MAYEKFYMPGHGYESVYVDERDDEDWGFDPDSDEAAESDSEECSILETPAAQEWIPYTVEDYAVDMAVEAFKEWCLMMAQPRKAA